MNFGEIANILKEQSMASVVKDTITKKVSSAFIDKLNAIEKDLISQIKGSTSLVFFENKSNNILNTIFQLVNTYSEDFEPTDGMFLSTDQYATMQRVYNMMATVHSYQSVIFNKNLINTQYAKLENLNLTRKISAKTLSELFTGDEELDGSSIEKFKRKSQISFEDVKGVDAEVSVIKTTLAASVLSDGVIFIAMAGPPGTGKSTLSHAMATAHSGGYFYNLGIGELSSPYIGTTEKMLRDLFEFAERTTEKITIILDEFDTVVGKDVTASHLQSAKTTLQTEISGGRYLGKNVLIIAITNFYDIIEDAIKRRITSVIDIPLPDKNLIIDFISSRVKIPIDQISRQFKTGFNEMISNINVTNANVKNWIESAKTEYVLRMGQKNINTIQLDSNSLLIVSDSIITSNQNITQFTFEKLSSIVPMPKVILLPELVDFKTSMNRITFLTNEDLLKFKRSGS